MADKFGWDNNFGNNPVPTHYARTKAVMTERTLPERLRMWPATEGRGDGLSSDFVGALMREAADALDAKPKYCIEFSCV